MEGFTFDFSSMAVSGVAIAMLIFGITEAVKEFTGATGKPVRAVALGMGILYGALTAARAQGVLSDDVWQVVEIVTVSLASGLAAMGYYHYQKKNGD